MCITGPSAGENRWMEVDGESRKAAGFPYPPWAFRYFTAPLITPLTTQRWAKM